MLSLDFLRRISLYQATLGVLGTLFYLFFKPMLGLHFGLGALIIGGNFWLMRFLMLRAFASPKSQLTYVGLLAIKLVAILAVMSLTLWLFKPDPLAFTLGLGSLFVAIPAAVVHTAKKPKESA